MGWQAVGTKVNSSSGRQQTWAELLRAFGNPRDGNHMTRAEWLQALQERRVFAFGNAGGYWHDSVLPWGRVVVDFDSWRQGGYVGSAVFSAPLPTDLQISQENGFNGILYEDTPARRQEKEDEARQQRRQKDLDAQLLQAAAAGDVEAARTALAEGATRDARQEVSARRWVNNQYWMFSHRMDALAIAVDRGHREMVRFLLDQGYSLAGSRGVEAIFCALDQGFDEIAELVAQRGIEESLLKLWSQNFIRGHLQANDFQKEPERGQRYEMLMSKLNRLVMLSQSHKRE